MRISRIIARLDIKGPNLVKGIGMEGLRVLGKPEDFARSYYNDGADELFCQDVVASLYERNNLESVISRIAKEVFIPLTVGGGIRTIDDIRTILRAGADRVCINTAAIKNPEFVRQASKIFGSSTVVVGIEAIRQPDGQYFAYTDNGRQYTGVEVVGWARKIEELGAGEIVVTSVNRDGGAEGFDIDLTRKVAEAVSLPVIAHGGAGRELDILQVLTEGKANAVVLASILHYDHIKKSRSTDFVTEEGNLAFLRSGRSFSKINPTDIGHIKNYLNEHSLNVRL